VVWREAFGVVLREVMIPIVRGREPDSAPTSFSGDMQHAKVPKSTPEVVARKSRMQQLQEPPQFLRGGESWYGGGGGAARAFVIRIPSKQEGVWGR